MNGRSGDDLHGVRVGDADPDHPESEAHPTDDGRSLAHRTVGGLGWMFLNAGGQIVLQIGVLAVLARLVSPSEFGLVAAATVTITLAEILADGGIRAALIQRARIDAEHIRAAFTLTLTLSVTVWIAVVLAAPAIATLLRLPSLTPLLRVAALTFVIRSMTVGDYLLARRMQFRALATIELSSFAGYAVVAVVLASRGWGAWALIDGQIAQAVIYTVLLWIVAPHPWRPCVARRPAGDLLSYGGGQFLGRLGDWMAMQGDNFVVGRTLGAESLGLYARAYAMMSLPANLFGQVANEVLFPAMASVQHEKAKLRIAYRHSVGVLALLALPASIVVAIMANEVVLVLLGPTWVPLEAAFSVMVFGMLFRTSYKLSDSLARATGAVYRRAWRQGVFAATVVVGAYLGHGWGIRGVAIGVLGALTTNFFLMAHLSLRLVEMSWRAFAIAHVPAIVLSVALLATVGPTTLFLRSVATPPVLILISGSVVAVLVVAFTVRRSHRLGFVVLTNLIEDTIRLAPDRASTIALRVCGPAYATASLDPVQDSAVTENFDSES